MFPLNFILTNSSLKGYGELKILWKECTEIPQNHKKGQNDGLVVLVLRKSPVRLFYRFYFGFCLYRNRQRVVKTCRFSRQAVGQGCIGQLLLH